jgi:2-polyprenyl-3-methyl-5-hydroxy-6-metoxy-1,4-benzoquinol methylase
VSLDTSLGGSASATSVSAADGTAPCCLVCAAPSSRERILYDDRYGYPGRWPVMLCSQCRHRNLDAKMDSAQLSELYTRFYPRSSFDVEAWSPPAEQSTWSIWWGGLKASAFRWVPRDVRVLDIGCGFGESLGYHRARGCDAHGVEADRNILRVAERHGLNVKVGLFDATSYEPATFDVVTLDQVIEHVTDPLAVLQGVHDVLKPGGTLVISTPNADGWGARCFGDRWIHWHAPYHLQFFSRRSMALVAAQAGFLLHRAGTFTNSAWLNYQWGHLVTYPVAGSVSAYWSRESRRTLAARLALKLLQAVDRAGINVLLTRLMDTLRQGDNIVYVLRKGPEQG